MEQDYEMVAVQRRGGKLLLTTLDGLKTFSLSETNLNKRGVFLGDIVLVTMDNDIPIEFKNIEKKNVKFEVVGPDIMGKGFNAKIELVKNRVYFNSSIFGKMNCLEDISSKLIGTSQLVVVKYQNEGDRLTFKWSAYIDESKKTVDMDLSSGEDNTLGGGINVDKVEGVKHENTRRPKNSMDSRKKRHRSKQTSRNNYDQSISSDVPRMPQYSSQISLTDVKVEKPSVDGKECRQTIDGIVVAKMNQGNYYYVWTKQSYPGKDVKLWNNAGVDLKVSDWIRMQLTESEVEKYFPREPKENTPQYECRSFIKIEPGLTTVATKNERSVMVTIPDFLKEDIEAGAYFDNRLGYLLDRENHLKEIGNYEITVIRRSPSEMTNGKTSVWYISKAVKQDNENAIVNYNNNNNSNDCASNSQKNKLCSSNVRKTRGCSSEESDEDIRLEDINRKTSSVDGEDTQIIEGIVVAKMNNVNGYYVWTKQAYPGKDVILWNNEGVNLKISDWIRMQLTESEVEKYFPREPKPETPRYECRSFSRIEQPRLRTVATENEKSVMVTIPVFSRIEMAIYNNILGYLKDDRKFLTKNGTFEITVVRSAPKQTSYGKITVWNVINAQKLSEYALCTGVITSIIKINGAKQYNCWLIDKHCSTCIENSNIDLLQGDFFKSTFKKINQGQWNHVNQCEMKRIKKVINFEEHENYIKFNIKVTINGEDTTKVEHEYFGSIIDKYNKLPKYALHGESTGISVMQEEIENRVCWVICD